MRGGIPGVEEEAYYNSYIVIPQELDWDVF